MIQITRLDPDDHEPLIASVQHISDKPVILGNAKKTGGIYMTESIMISNKTDKHKNKGIEIKDRARAPDTVNAKSLDVFVGGLGGVEDLKHTFKIAKTDRIAAKSLDVLVRGLEDTFKIAEIDTVTTISSDISVESLEGIGSLGGTMKNVIMVIKKWKTLKFSETRVDRKSVV